MDLKDILNKLDSIQEAEIDPAQLAVQEKQRFANKKAHLFSLLQRLRDIVNSQVKEGSNLEKDLIESFGYTVNEMDMTKLSQSSASTASATAATAGDSILKTIGKKIAWPVTAAAAIWDAYEQIVQLPRDVPEETFKKEVLKIIGNIVGEYGVFAVGAGIGAALGGASGPGALVSGIAGGLAAQWAFGDDINKLVDYIVSQLYEGEPTQEPATTTSAADTSSNITDKSAIKELQTALSKVGLNLGPTGSDGIVGPYTVNALKQYTDSSNLPNDLESIAKLLNIDSSTMSESEKIAELKTSLLNIEEAKIPSKAFTFAKNLIAKTGGGVKRFIQNHKFLSAIAGITAGGYVWDHYGDIVQSKAHDIAPSVFSAPDAEPKTEPTPTSAPKPGAGASSVPAVNPEIQKLVNDIKVDITDLKRITSPEIIPDAQKAIAHAEKTLQLYAPGVVNIIN